MSFRSFVLGPFYKDDRVWPPLVVVYVLVNLLALVNAVLHGPRIGYDAIDHMDYFETLAEGRLPEHEETREFFSPPLPYCIPAIIYNLTGKNWFLAGKSFQLLNFLCSLGLTFYLLKICRLIRPGRPWLGLAALGLLGTMSVYFRTFSFLRGEPMLAFLFLWATHEVLKLIGPERPTGGQAVGFGVLVGLVILSRQWGIFLVPGAGVLLLVLGLKRPRALGAYAKYFCLSMGIAFMTGGWFYVNLYKRHGTFTAFNRERVEGGFSFSNQPREFYFSLGLDRLFTNPLRDVFANRLIPTLYSDSWGDYWCYFLVRGYDARRDRYLHGFHLFRELKRDPDAEWLRSNHTTIHRYLGRINAVMILPTLILLVGLALGVVDLFRFALSRRWEPSQATLGFLALLVGITLVGYLWFLISFPKSNGNTIKASYILQVYPLAAILGAEALCRLRSSRPRGFRVVMALLGLALLHQLPALVTRYIIFPWPSEI